MYLSFNAKDTYRQIASNGFTFLLHQAIDMKPIGYLKKKPLASIILFNSFYCLGKQKKRNQMLQ